MAQTEGSFAGEAPFTFLSDSLRSPFQLTTAASQAFTDLSSSSFGGGGGRPGMALLAAALAIPAAVAVLRRAVQQAMSLFLSASDVLVPDDLGLATVPVPGFAVGA